HGGQDGRGVAHLALLAQDAVLEVAIAAALAEPRPVAPDPDRSADDQVDGPHLAWCDGPAVPRGGRDARRRDDALRKSLRVQLDEALLGTQPRYRHVEDLALGECEPPHRELRRIGIHLDDQRATPHGELAQQLCSLLGAVEVRNTTASPRKAAHTLALNRRPDLLADLRLGHRASTPDRARGRLRFRCYRSVGRESTRTSRRQRADARTRESRYARPCDAPGAGCGRARAKSASGSRASRRRRIRRVRG